MILNPNESYEDELWDSQKQRERERTFARSIQAGLAAWSRLRAGPASRFSLGLRAKKFALPGSRKS